MRKLYSVNVGSRWGMTTNKRTAVKAAKENGGQVRWMPYPDSTYWDWPTFYACSQPLQEAVR